MFDELLAPLFTTAWGRRAGLGAAIGMLLLFGLTVIQTFYIGWQDATLSHRLTLSSAQPTAIMSEVTMLVAEIPSWHLFGKYGVLDNSAELPITSLQLHLVGIDKAMPEKFSHALLSEAGQPAKVYKVGDNLSADVIIYAITPEGVILKNGARLEKLPLQRPTLKFEAMPKPMLNSQEDSL